MKKIILAFDGTAFSEGAFEFARRLHELQPVLLTGIFLPRAALADLWSYAGGAGTAHIALADNGEGDVVQKNIEHFEKRCNANGISYRVHKDFYELALAELKKESRYADLLILGTEVFYKNSGTTSANDYVREALHDVVCPVLLVPEIVDFPESIILAYNGSEEAVYAIKQFAYLFPELTNKQTLLVYASNHAGEDIPDKMQMEELVSRHFTNLTLLKLNIQSKKDFSTWVLEKKSAMLVSGSYGRSGLSELFKNSFIKEIIGSHRLPVFIAHK